MNDKLRNQALWGLIILFALFNALKPVLLDSVFDALIPVISILSPLGFVLLHGPRQIGWRQLLVFFVIAFFVSWGYESLSIKTGFPFGHYHYTDRLGPKLGDVPLLIMPAYYAICYISWHLAHIVLDKFDQVTDSLQSWAVPVLAGLIMVMWDMSMDPARSTLAEAWIWHDGGGYFGVPFENFMGWFLCVWTIFQLYALYLRWQATPAPVSAQADEEKNHWHQMTALYGALLFDFWSMAALATNTVLVDQAGQRWNSRDMYESLALVSIFSMFFVTVLCFIKVQSAKQLR
ncbi:MAG: carotenoid biosynthesis protein [Caldilineaceae bacterium]